MDQIYQLLAIMLGAILANNFIFSQFLGICPFLGVSKKVDTAVGMGIAVTFVRRRGYRDSDPVQRHHCCHS